jgi:hypothetical protein
MDYQVLQDEITNDPLARGYSGMTDSEVTDSLNTVNRTYTRDTVTGSEILNVTDDAEFAALTDVNKDRWMALCGIGSIDTSSGIAKALEADIFGAGTTTRDNMVDLKNPDCSRATELGLPTVKVGDVEYVRSLP